MSRSRVIARKVQDAQERRTYIPEIFGPLANTWEFGVLNQFAAMVPEYEGGAWGIYRLSNGGIYLAPLMDPNEPIKLVVPTNGFSGFVSPDAAGIIASLFSTNRLVWKYPARKDLRNLFYKLQDFAYQHAEACEIARAID